MSTYAHTEKYSKNIKSFLLQLNNTLPFPLKTLEKFTP